MDIRYALGEVFTDIAGQPSLSDSDVSPGTSGDEGESEEEEILISDGVQDDGSALESHDPQLAAPEEDSAGPDGIAMDTELPVPDEVAPESVEEPAPAQQDSASEQVDLPDGVDVSAHTAHSNIDDSETVVATPAVRGRGTFYAVGRGRAALRGLPCNRGHGGAHGGRGRAATRGRGTVRAWRR